VSDGGDSSRDPRRRPADPAGTQPKVDPDSLLPQSPLRPGALPEGVVEGEAVEDEGTELTPGAGEGDLLPERRPGGGVGAVAAAPPPPPHQARFHFVYGALAALAAAAVAVLVVVLAGGGADNGSGGLASWSRWHPSQDEVAGANQIAGHVGPQYRLAGRQIVSVQASAMDFEGIPLSVAVREPPTQGGAIHIFDSGGFIYRLCGLGPSCSIAEGKPSPERLMLLRREALELSLYSFRYLDTADQVVVLLPPPPGERPSQAVFIRRGDVERELDRPLDRSLARRTPTVQTIGLSPDAGLVDRITGARMFKFSLTQANTANRGFLVLDPVLVSTTQQQVSAQHKSDQTPQRKQKKQRGK
jgi:hypothetical protein